MACTPNVNQVTVEVKAPSGTGGGTGGDKFYDCVDGKCIEKAGGQYKNDPKCGGKCEEPTDWGLIALAATAIIAAALILQAKGNK